MRGAHSSGSDRGFLPAWALAFVVLLVLMVTWSLATPIEGAPDDAAQMIKAAATVRGEWLGSPEPPPAVAADRRVEVPAEEASQVSGECFPRHPTTPAGCEHVNNFESMTNVTTTTYVAHYPPLYYLLVGWPTLLVGGAKSLYLMRVMSAVVNAALLASAWATAYRWSRSSLLLAALSVAVTPMTLFLSSVVTPSGLEATSAIAVWTGASVLAVDYPTAAPSGLVASIGGAASVLLLVRGLSPLWALVCLLALMPLFWRRLALRSLVARRVVWASGALIAAAAIAALSWTVLAHSLTVRALGVPPPGTDASTIARDVVGQDRDLIAQAVGVFGWLDTPAPLLTELIWYGTGGGLVLLAVLFACRRGVMALGAVVAAGAIIPFVLADAAARHDGLIAQGRYFLPLLVGVPIVAGALIPRSVVPGVRMRRVAALVVSLCALGQIAAAIWALRRYLVGSDGPLSPTSVVAGVWRPPLPGWLLDAVFVIGWVAGAVLIVRFGLPADPDGPSGHDDAPSRIAQDRASTAL